jgi:hypothetical protein
LLHFVFFFQLRYLQTLNSIAAEHNSTIIFPMPIDIGHLGRMLKWRWSADVQKWRWYADAPVKVICWRSSAGDQLMLKWRRSADAQVKISWLSNAGYLLLLKWKWSADAPVQIPVIS